MTDARNAAAIRLTGVSKGFGAVRAVEGFDLELGAGKILVLLGPSGCGKTTALRVISGFEAPDSGEVEISGQLVAGRGKAVPPEKRRVGMVFQDYALFPHLTVARNVSYGLKGYKGKKRDARVEEVLALARLTGLEDRMPHELSGGQQQRVALARALAPEPAVVLLDEPFSNLDAGLRAEVRVEMRGILKRAGATAIFVTHDRAEALSLADEVAVMLDGRIVQLAPPEELYHRPATRQVATLVGEANFLPGTLRGRRFVCDLGELPAVGAAGAAGAAGAGDLVVEAEAAGEAQAMLRPEALFLRADRAGRAVVLGREFYGHDQLIVLRLDSGRTVNARLGAGPGFGSGQRVAVEVVGPALVFPK